MPAKYSTVFDLISSPDRIQPTYWFYAIFILAGAFLLLISVAAWRLRWRSRIILTLFSTFWLGLTSWVSVTEVEDVMSTRRAVERGSYETVEGCLDYFRPGNPGGSRSTAQNEQWRVAGRVFSYGQGEPQPFYHQVSGRDGAVSPDSRVRVSFVMSDLDGSLEVVRLLVAKNACPPARLVKPNTQP